MTDSAAGRFSSFAALGDSFTEGMEDELGPDGRHLGWADRVASALAAQRAGLRYANLAVRGRLLDEVVDEQVPVALELAPDLVSFHAGGNDLLRAGVDVDAVLRRYEDAVAALRPAVGELLLFTLVERLDDTGRVGERLARRFEPFNGGVRETARRHRATVVDLGAARALRDRRLFHADRLHLNPQGHARVAAAVLEAVGVRDEALLGGPAGWWREPLPPRDVTRPAAVAEDVRWLQQHLLPWLWRRARGISSGDGIEPKRPGLAPVGEHE
jgi:lysophospholipase L1-like esterase